MRDNNTSVRRKDREVSDESFFKEMLRTTPHVSIGMIHNSLPYVNFNLFVYDEKRNCIYFHTAGQGYTKEIIRQNNNVCLSIARLGRLYPAPKALDFGAEYFSVVAYGTAEIVDEDEEISHAFTIFLTKYFPHLSEKNYQRFTQEEARRPTVFRVTISDWTAKKHEVAADYPGAFIFGTPQKTNP